MNQNQNQALALLKAETPQITALLRLNSAPGTDVETLAAQELEFLQMAAVTKQDILQCIPHTVVMAVKTVLKQNLSLDPYAGLVYIKTRSINVGTQQNPQWAKALEIMPTCNGLLSINYQCGKIKDHKIPDVIKDSSGKVVAVEFEYLLSTGRWEKRKFDESDFLRWKTKSHQENARNKQDANFAALNYSNTNYSNWNGGIDPEFARAKAIRHSLKKLGTNPNEKRAINIVVPEEKKIIIDPEKEASAINDDELNNGPSIQEVEIISETPHAANAQVPSSTDL